MFELFFSLFLALFRGRWLNCTFANITNGMVQQVNKIGEFLTSIFGDFQVANLGSYLFGTSAIQGVEIQNYLILVSFVLALITSIGIVVVATKGIKKLFTVFFYGVR